MRASVVRVHVFYYPLLRYVVAGLHGRRRRLDGVGNLLVAQFVVVAQAERRPLLWRQRLYSPLQAHRLKVAVVGVAVGGDAVGAALVLFQRHRLLLARADQSECLVVGNPEYPAAQRRGVTALVERPEYPDECLLRGVLSVGVCNHQSTCQ